GSLRGLHLVVADVSEAREALAGRGVEVSDVVEQPGGIKYAYFSDPDGNSWALQQMLTDV
ncbi:MAG: VOC family protein, partial [Chloroflexia bacterium]